MLAALATIACLAACGSPSDPVPVGAGPEFQPPARWPLAGGAAFHGINRDVNRGARFHLELFADGRVIVVPGGIGVAGARTTLHGFITDAPGRADAWTLFAGGVFHFAREGMTLGDVFAIWGQSLGPDRLLDFRGDVRVYVAGERRHGDPRTLRLHDRDQVVVQVGPYVPPHPAFTFRPRLLLHSDTL